MRFEKWQALGNDYLIVEADELPFALTPARVRRLCAGHFGVFADGVLELSRPAEPVDVADLRIYNPDGSEAELSGNGAREAIMYLRTRGWTERDEFSINTAAGRIRPRITGSQTCRVDMGRASLTSKDFPGGPADGRGELSVEAKGEGEGGDSQARVWRFQHVSIGNPQCAIGVASIAELEQLDLETIGPGIEAHRDFPNRTNVSWYTELQPPTAAERQARIRARIFERGVGETLSSGTGATGAAVAYLLSGDARERGGRVTVELDGGELEVEVGEDLGVNLTGWARPVFDGRLSDDFVKELNETE
jgi:diaminopimelate epimerase